MKSREENNPKKSRMRGKKSAGRDGDGDAREGIEDGQQQSGVREARQVERAS